MNNKKNIDTLIKLVNKWFNFMEQELRLIHDIDKTEAIMTFIYTRISTELAMDDIKLLTFHDDSTNEGTVYVGFKDGEDVYLFRNRVKTSQHERGRVLEFIIKNKKGVIKRYYSLLEGGYGFTTTKLEKLPKNAKNQVDTYMKTVITK